MQELPIYDDPALGTRVRGQNEVIVESAEDVLGLIGSAQADRKVAATAMNMNSSRSHTITRVIVENIVAGRCALATSPPSMPACLYPSICPCTMSKHWKAIRLSVCLKDMHSLVSFPILRVSVLISVGPFLLSPPPSCEAPEASECVRRAISGSS